MTAKQLRLANQVAAAPVLDALFAAGIVGQYQPASRYTGNVALIEVTAKSRVLQIIIHLDEWHRRYQVCVSDASIFLPTLGHFSQEPESLTQLVALCAA